ncbi:MAG: hypothetical protein LAP86_26865 [Acidobacteriia bacterium]|nr:hypothetical protein [Terriglobia bacterium]
MRVLGRVAAAAGVGILVLVLGVFTAIVLVRVFLPDANADGGVAPGDGFLVLEFIAIGVLVCVPLSIAAASWVLFRAARNSKQELSPGQSELFLGR